jgi:flagellar biosynthesis protein FliQ
MMTPEAALEIMHFTLLIAFKVSAPYLIASVVVGVGVNIFQTVTSLKDQSLTFVPKVVAVAVVGLLTMPWQVTVVLGYFDYVFSLFGSL